MVSVGLSHRIACDAAAIGSTSVKASNMNQVWFMEMGQARRRRWCCVYGRCVESHGESHVDYSGLRTPAFMSQSSEETEGQRKK